MKNAVCLITFNPTEKLEYLHFLNSFDNFDIYVIIDDNSINYDNLKDIFNKISFIQIEDDLCLQSGYINISYITLKKLVSGWDKAIYYFTTQKTDYLNVWFFEDDVYFYSEMSILKIDDKYNEQDILCNSSYDEAKLDEWLWKYIEIDFEPPYFCGMMCALRLSKKYLHAISCYVKKNKTMFFLEAFFPTLAKKYKLKYIENPAEFITITHRDHIPNTVALKKNYLYHPVKDLKKHSFFRNADADADAEI
jgi:hypothetical protein